MQNKLINAVIKNKHQLPYINIGKDNKYQGWTYDFNIVLSSGTKMNLDLKKDNDLFLLFVLASAWTKTGPWENGAFFATYLKESKKDSARMWLDSSFVNSEIINRAKNSLQIVKLCDSATARKKVSFRKDYYLSVVVLAENWDEIKNKLEDSNIQNDYEIFIDYIGELNGLGTGNNKMRIKIPLILRELRCQNIYSNIPGELCCVPDNRVRKSAKEIGVRLPSDLFGASKVIYDHFGDLYDIPLFAYEDVKADML